MTLQFPVMLFNEVTFVEATPTKPSLATVKVGHRKVQ